MKTGLGVSCSICAVLLFHLHSSVTVKPFKSVLTIHGKDISAQIFTPVKLVAYYRGIIECTFININVSWAVFASISI